MSEDIIEKVARTLAERRAGVVDDIDRGNARAAIEAMREPSGEMIRAGCLHQQALGRTGISISDTWSVWEAMIDAALKP